MFHLARHKSFCIHFRKRQEVSFETLVPLEIQVMTSISKLLLKGQYWDQTNVFLTPKQEKHYSVLQSLKSIHVQPFQNC